MRNSRVAIGLLASVFGVLACGSPLSVATPLPAATGVALTLQAIASETAQALPVPSPTLPVPPLLPRPLYFLDHDAAGHTQVFRLGVDGRAVHQITFEPVSVDSYDVSPADACITYTSNNQLFLVTSDGSGRRMLLDGGPVEHAWSDRVGSPVWSPDGTTLAYSHGGLKLLSLNTDETRTGLANQVDTSPGFPIVHELYAPNSYSPDGSRLLINIGFYEGGTYGIYSLADGSLVRFQRADGDTLCCHASWIPDGRGIYIASPSLGMIESGLFYADAFSGQVSTLLPTHAPDGSHNFADAAQAGPDGKLYFFFDNLLEIPASGHAPLFLVRSSSDGITGRTRMLPDAFQNLNEVLWSPDATLAVLVIAPDPKTFTGGRAEIIYPDGRPSVPLVPSARDLRWGP